MSNDVDLANEICKCFKCCKECPFYECKCEVMKFLHEEVEDESKTDS